MIALAVKHIGSKLKINIFYVLSGIQDRDTE